MPQPNRPFVAVLLLLIVRWSVADAQPATLPQGVRFELNGVAIDDDAFFAFVGAEYRAEKDAPALLQSMSQERVIDLEARRRGFSVSDREVAERCTVVDRQMRTESRGSRDLRTTLAESKVSEFEFRLVLRRSMLLERIVRDELGRPGGELSDARMTLWLQDRMKRALVVTAGLPDHLVARVDDEPISVTDFGQRYAAQFAADDPRTQGIENEFLRVELVRQEFERRGFRLTDADLDAAIAQRERALHARPGFADISLDDFLGRTGSSVAILRGKPGFRTQLRLLRLVDEVFYPGPGLYFFYRSHKREFDRLYGPTVDLATVFLKAGDEGAVKAGLLPRRYDDAIAELTALRNRLLDGSAVFASLASSRSQHPTAPAGGALGQVGAEHAEFGELAKAALAADPATRYLGPLRVTGGVHLLEIRGRRPRPEYPELIDTVRRHAGLKILDALARRAHVVRRAGAG